MPRSHVILKFTNTVGIKELIKEMNSASEIGLDLITVFSDSKYLYLVFAKELVNV